LYPSPNETEQEFEDRLHTLLFETFKSAVVRFFNSKTPLTREDSMETFFNDLRPIEIEIIGLYMLREYYRKQMDFLVSLKHSFSDKDFKSHDKSNQLNQYRQLLKETEEEINSLIIKNSYISNAGVRSGWWEVNE
jgi:hypothetical protein